MFYKIPVYYYWCDDCKAHYETSDFSDLRDIRKLGWAISKDYKKCYCPKCAPKHRNVGRPSWRDLYKKKYPDWEI